MAKKEAKAPARVAEISIALPVVEAGEQPGYQSELIEAGELPLDISPARFNVSVGGRGASAFVRVRNGLREQNAKLQDGRPVYSNADALRWILDAIADELGA